MNKPVAFDTLAAGYDAVFSASLIGQAQRRLTRQWLMAFLCGKKNLKILEINCGTGEDAWWLASLGHTVIATDQSTEMIRKAQYKAMHTHSEGSVRFITCGFEELGAAFNGEQFDLIFSNFAGLNCATPAELSAINIQLQKLLSENGHLAAVIFGKYTLWETLYFLGKGHPGEAFRRWSNQRVLVPLAESVIQPVYYYSITGFARIMRSFRLIKKQPVGLCIPPSYLENAMQKRPRFFHWLVKMEAKAKRYARLSSLADHTYLLFKKETT
jgi:ubiquinone/menaquinone biosynthesis C-methylase UbiE